MGGGGGRERRGKREAKNAGRIRRAKCEKNSGKMRAKIRAKSGGRNIKKRQK